MPTAADVVWVDVLPSMQNFLGQLRSKSQSAATSAGASAGQSFGRAFGSAATNGVDAAAARVSAAQRKAADAAGALRVAEARLQDTRESSRAKAASLVAAEERVAKAQREVERTTREATQAQNQHALAQASAGRAATDLTGRIERQSVIARGIGGAWRTAGAVIRAAWLPATAAVGAAGAVGLRTASQLEQSRIGFTQMLGSAQAADTFLRKLADFAAKSPFELPDVTTGAQRLMAMGIAADDVIPYLTAIGNSVAAMGGGKEQIDRVTIAIGQMAAKGRIQSEELLQLTEAGIPALKILAAQYGVSAQEMQKMVTEGKVLSDRALPLLIDGLQNGTSATQAFGGMMEAQSRSLRGIWSTFKDSVQINLAQAFDPLIPSIKNAMEAATPLVASFLERFSAWSATLVKQIPNLFGAIAAADAQGIGEVIDNIMGNTGRHVATFRGIAESVIPVVRQLGDLFGNLRGIAADLGPVLGTVLGGALRLAWESLNLILPALVSFTGFLADNRPAALAFAGAIVAINAAMVAHNVAMAVAAAGGMRAWITQLPIIRGLVAGWTAVQWALNAALAANPIVLIIAGLAALGAALVLAYRNSETFRNIVDAAFRAVADAGVWLWENALRPAFDGIMAAWRATSDGISWAWNSVLRPAWDAVATAATWLWANVLQPAFTGITTAWRALVDGIQWAWNNVLRPTWDFVTGAANVLYQILAVLVFGPTLLAWTALVEGIKWAWENILRPAWDAVSAAARWLWDNVLSVYFGLIRAGWDLLLAYIRFAWENVLRPTWDAVSAAIRFLWENVARPVWDAMRVAWEGLAAGLRFVYDRIISPAFEALKGALQTVQDKFATVVDWIRLIWNGLKSALAKPINFMIGTVWNNGIRKAWNLVARVLPGVDEIGEAQLIPENAAGGQVQTDYAKGGKVRGPWRGPAADNVLAMVDNKQPIRVNPREWIHPVAAVDDYGSRFMADVQHRQFPRELVAAYYSGNLATFATGGELFAEIRKQFPRARSNSMYRPGDPGYHGRNMAVDLGEEGFSGGRGRPYLAAMKRWLVDNFGRSSEIIYNGLGNDRPNIKNGANFAYSAAVQAQHRNHVHWAQAGALSAARNSGAAGLGNFFKDVGGGVVDIVRGLLDQVVDLFTSPMRALVNTIPFDAPPSFLGIPKKWGHSIIDKASDFFNQKAEASAQESYVGGDTALAAYNGPLVDTVKRVFATRGWGDGPQWAATDWIIQHESGWNPRAQNPTSTASGLFQHIDSTWRAYRPREAAQFAKMRMAPVTHQAIAGANYIGGRHGTPTRAKAYWVANQHYATGGQVPYFHDGGTTDRWNSEGLAVLNPDERILTPAQDNYASRLVSATLTAERATELTGALYLDSGEFLGYVRGVVGNEMEDRDSVSRLDVRSSRL